MAKQEAFEPTNVKAYSDLLRKFKKDIDDLYFAVYGTRPDSDYYSSSSLERLGRDGDNLGARLTYSKKYKKY